MEIGVKVNAPFEYAKLGLPFDHPVGRFEEAFEIIRRLLAGERFDFHGDFHELLDTWLSPIHRHAEGPLRGSDIDPWLDDQWRQAPTEAPDIPLMAGSLGARMLEIMLPHVSGWNVHWSHPRFWNTPERFPDIVGSVGERSKHIDRDPSELWSSAEVYMTFPGSHGLPIEVPDDLTPLPADVETLHRCDVAGIDHLIVLVDPQTPKAVEQLGEMVREHRSS